MRSPALQLVFTSVCLIAVAVAALPLLAQDCPDLHGQPRFLGTWGAFDHLAATPVGQDLLAAVTSDSILVIYRVQAEAPPAPLCSVPLPGDYRWLAALDDHIYVTGDHGVKIFRVRDDGDLEFNGRLTGFEPAGQIKADGDLLAMIHEGAWSLWDCRDRAQPVRLARVGFETNSYSFQLSRIAVGGDKVAVDGVVYDISRPTEPALVGYVPGDSTIAGCEIAGDRLYELRIWTDSGGDWIYGDRWYYRSYTVLVRDLTDTSEFGILARHQLKYNTSWPPGAPKTVLAKSGGYVIAGQTSDNNVLMIDTTAPVDATPWHIPAIPARSLAWQQEQLVGFGDGVWSWSVPATTAAGRVPVSSAGTGGSGYGPGYSSYGITDMAVSGGLVAVNETWEIGDDMFWDYGTLIRLYQPESGDLDPISSVDFDCDKVALLDGVLLAASQRLYAFDITDPTTPGDRYAVGDIDRIMDLVALDGGTIAVGDSWGVFTIYDLSNPVVPVRLGQCQLGDRAGLMTFDGSAVLVTVPGKHAVKVVDVSDRTAPRVRDVVKVPGTVRQIEGRQGLGLALVYHDRGSYQVDFSYGVPLDVPQFGQGVEPQFKPVRVTKQNYSATCITVHGPDMFLSGGGLHAYDPVERVFRGSVSTSHPVLGAVSCRDQLYAVCVGELVGLSGYFCDKPRDGVPGGISGAATPDAPLEMTVAPNPFNPMTRVAFTLAREQVVEVGVYDLKGRLVRTLARGTWTADRHAFDWNGRDDRGRELPSGVYFVHLKAGSESVATKVTLVR